MRALKIFIAKILTSPFVGKILRLLYGAELKIMGLRVFIADVAVKDSIVASLFWGFYESAERRCIANLVHPELDVVELGSSLGIVSSVIGKTKKESSRLFCVEANNDLHSIIRTNLNVNNIKQASIIPCAISSSPLVTFQKGCNNTVGKINTDNTASEVFQVKGCTLSSILSIEGIGDYVLISDIEGAESYIIYEDKAALLHCKEIIIELHENNFVGDFKSVDDLYNEFMRSGFRLHKRDGNVFHFLKNNSA